MGNNHANHVITGCFIVGVALGLVGCTSAQVSSTVADVKSACVTIQPALTIGAVSTNAEAKSIASFGNAICGPVAAGSVPSTVDASTATWLGTLGGMIKTLLPLAMLMF